VSIEDDDKVATKRNGEYGGLTDDQVQKLRDLGLESKRLGHVLLCQLGERLYTRKRSKVTHVLVGGVGMRVGREE